VPAAIRARQLGGASPSSALPRAQTCCPYSFSITDVPTQPPAICGGQRGAQTAPEAAPGSMPGLLHCTQETKSFVPNALCAWLISGPVFSLRLQFLDGLRKTIGVGVGGGGNDAYEMPSAQGLDYYVSAPSPFALCLLPRLFIFKVAHCCISCCFHRFTSQFWPARLMCCS